MGGETIDDAVVQSLLGAPRGEVQHELADAIAVGDARTAFEIVNRLVQDGQDLRNVTAEALAHFRNLLLVQTAPGQEDLLDIPADGYAASGSRVTKFTPGELARVLALLLAAQNDMRWTTSPRLSLELALVRATLPETDPNPAGVVARLERLERLANLDPPGAAVPPARHVGHGARPRSVELRPQVAADRRTAHRLVPRGRRRLLRRERVAGGADPRSGAANAAPGRARRTSPPSGRHADCRSARRPMRRAWTWRCCGGRGRR